MAIHSHFRPPNVSSEIDSTAPPSIESSASASFATSPVSAVFLRLLARAAALPLFELAFGLGAGGGGSGGSVRR